MPPLFDATIPSWLALVGCVAIDFGLDVAKYAYVGGENDDDDDDDPAAPVVLGVGATTPPTPIRYLIPLGAATVAVGVVLVAVAAAFVPVTLLVPILAVRFATGLVFSWAVIGIAPSRRGKLGIACYAGGLLALLLLAPWRRPVALLDADAFLALYTSPTYVVWLVASCGAVALSALVSRSPLMTSVVVGSHAPALAKQLAAIAALGVVRRSVNLSAVVVVALAAASYWLWDRRLRTTRKADDLLRMHLGFNLAALVNGAALFEELPHWRVATATSLCVVMIGVGLLAWETFSGGGKDVETTARRSSWKELSRTCNGGRGSEIMRLGQPPPALSLPVRNMAPIVFAPATTTTASAASGPRKSVLMVANQARKSIKGVVIDLDSDGPTK